VDSIGLRDICYLAFETLQISQILADLAVTVESIVILDEWSAR
jgi:hypothetical protein